MVPLLLMVSASWTFSTLPLATVDFETNSPVFATVLAPLTSMAEPPLRLSTLTLTPVFTVRLFPSNVALTPTP